MFYKYIKINLLYGFFAKIYKQRGEGGGGIKSYMGKGYVSHIDLHRKATVPLRFENRIKKLSQNIN
jgi:hypothetical protein